MTDAAKAIERARELLALDQMEGNAATAGHQEYLHRLAVNVLPALLDVLEEDMAGTLCTRCDEWDGHREDCSTGRALDALERELPPS